MVEEQHRFIESGGAKNLLDNLVDDFDDVDVVELNKKLILLEHDQIIKTLEISRLEGENKAQGRNIVELQFSVGELSARLIDLSQKLVAKFGNKFSDKIKDRVSEVHMNTSPEQEK